MNTNKYMLIIFAALIFLAVGCDKEDGTEVYNGGDNFHFLEDVSSADEASATPVAIRVIFTKTEMKTGSVSFTITSDNAVENVDYVVLNTTTTFDFATDMVEETIFIQPIDNQVLDGDKVLTIALTNGTEALGWPGPDALFSTHTFTILDDDCATPLVGTFTESTAGGAGDGTGAIGQAVDPFPWAAVLTVTKASCDGDGKYTIDDITMGLYPVGYGSAVNPATFINNGGSLTIIAAESQDIVYGGDEFSGSGGVVDDDTFTLNWTNGWGDQGNSTLFRQ